MKCPNCGREIAEGAPYCQYCITPIQRVVPEKEQGDGWIALISFLNPTIGLLLCLIYQKKNTLLSKVSLEWAMRALKIGAVLCLVLFFGTLFVSCLNRMVM